ncbi:MAG: LysM peptidoglycan-binding domain-containing protein [Chloroflexota bacterium]
MHSRITFLTLFLLVGLLAAGGNLAAEPAGQISTPAPDITCDQLVVLAETSVALVCDGLGRNQACYGNRLVSVEFQPNSGLAFQQSGDTVDLLAVRRLSTSPLNIQNRDWGIAVVKAQANLPDALPGQNVTFLLYGDTTVDNPSPSMNAVTVSTRIGSTTCTDVPDSAVLIQSPSGSQVAMNINGADVTLGSTAYITAQQGSEFTFAVVEGTGVIISDGVERTVLPGAQVRIPLGGVDGLQADGAPSELEPFDAEAIGLAPFRLLDRRVTIPEPLQPGQTAPNTDTPTPAVNQTPETTACVPRTDWPYRYVIQPAETLYDIAAKLNMRVDDLQAGDCIDDPIRLIAGTSIQVPRPVATRTPTTAPVAATSTAAATQFSNVYTGPDLRADKDTLYGDGDDCTFIRWDLENIDSVYFEGSPVVGHGAQQVCPTYTTTYTLVVVAHDGTRTSFTITINYGYSS